MPPSTTKLKTPPIVEAVIDIGVTAAPEFQVGDLVNLRSHFVQDYPDIQELRTFAQTFRVNLASPETKPTVTPSIEAPQIDHYRYASPDKLSIAIVRREQLTFSRLAPYTSWEIISTQAERFWREYRQLAKPVKITRLGVRYINRILLPLPLPDLGQYLVAAPIAPQGLPSGIGHFVSQVIIPIEEGIHAAVVQTLEGGPRQGYLPLILDISAVRSGDLDINDDEAWRNALQKLREIKNQAFYGSLTARTIQLFDHE